MTNAIVPTHTGELVLSDLYQAGQVANRIAARSVFKNYRERMADNTIARQDDDLESFAKFLLVVGVQPGLLNADPEAWRGITFGIAEAFARWLLQDGYSIGTVNLRLSSVKTYARLAMQAGALTSEEYTLIRSVRGYSRTEGERVDKAREVKRKQTTSARVNTRAGVKVVERKCTRKVEPVSLTPDQADQLKAQPDRPQGRRDALLMCLLLDLGLRVGEVVSLQVEAVDVKGGTITFEREKVHMTQTHRLINGSWEAARKYLTVDALASGPLLRASVRGHKLGKAGMTRFGIAKRVAELGEAIGVSGLSPHDLRHAWATAAARSGTPIDRLQDAGGWSSPAMPLQYIEAAKIANEGVRLDGATTGTR